MMEKVQIEEVEKAYPVIGGPLDGTLYEAGYDRQTFSVNAALEKQPVPSIPSAEYVAKAFNYKTINYKLGSLNFGDGMLYFWYPITESPKNAIDRLFIHYLRTKH